MAITKCSDVAAIGCNAASGSPIGTVPKGSTTSTYIGIAFRIDVHVSDIPGSVTGIPPGLNVCWCAVAGNGNNFVAVYGTPTTQGNYDLLINGSPTNVLLRIRIDPQPTPIVTNDPPDGRKGVAYTYTVAVGAGNAAPINNAVVSISGFPDFGLDASGSTVSGVPNFQTVPGPDKSFNVNITCTGNAAGTNTVKSIEILEAAPYIIMSSSATAYVGQPFSFTIQAPDISYPPPAGQLTASKANSITISPALPAGLTLNAVDSNGTATITGTPTTTICDRPTGFYTITASNTTGGSTTSVLTLTVLDERYPILPNADLGKIYINEAASINISATAGCPTSFAGSLLPTGLAVSTSDNGTAPFAVLSGTPTGTPGIYDSSGLVGPFYHPALQITGTNAVARSGTGIYDLIVGYRQSVFTNPDPDDPCTLNLEWVNGSAGFSFDCEATNSPQTFTADAFIVPVPPTIAGSGTTTTGLPSGLSINASSGVISGTPSVAANLLPLLSVVTLTVNNFGAYGPVPADPVNTAKITIRLVATAAEITPVITSDLNPRMDAPNEAASGIRGITMSYQITASHCPTSFGATNLPPGLVFNSSTGLISGEPTTVGYYHSTVSATNVWGTGNAVVNFIISYPAPVITSILTTFGVRGELFDPPVSLGGGVPAGYHITASVADPSDIPPAGLFFEATDILPNGLTVSHTTGVISGTILTSVSPGIQTVSIYATNADAYFDIAENAYVPALPAPVSELLLHVFSPPPTITSINPDSDTSVGGSTMTITGTGFLTGAVVCFGRISFTCVTPATVTETSITVTIPPLAVDDDLYTVAVKNLDGQVGVLDDALLITAPGVSAVPIARYTSLYSTLNPIYSINLTGGRSNRKRRIFALGTNMEVLFYSGVDTVNNRILNVYRRQLGTTSTRHGPGDLVFKGIASIQLSPLLYKASSGRKIAHIDCVLRSNGKIEMRTREISGSHFNDNTELAYAAYQAILIKTLNLIPLPKLGTDECIEDR